MDLLERRERAFPDERYEIREVIPQRLPIDFDNKPPVTEAVGFTDADMVRLTRLICVRVRERGEALSIISLMHDGYHAR